MDLLYEDAKKDRAKIEYLEETLQVHRDHRPVVAKEHLEHLTYKHELEELKNRVHVLEQYNRELHEENTALKAAVTCKSVVIDDAAYAVEADAPAHTYVEEKLSNEIVVQKEEAEEAEDAELKEESTKTVKMVGNKTKQEYQREYQRKYRKNKKNVMMNQ